MKTCGVCNTACADADDTCPACGEASWIGAPAAPAAPTGDAATAIESMPGESAPASRKRGR